MVGKQIHVWVGVTAVWLAGLTLLPQADAQISELEFQKGRARAACRNQAEQQALAVNDIVATIPISDGGGQLVGSEVILNVNRAGNSYNVRCDYDNFSGTATIANLPEPDEGLSRPNSRPTEGNFLGRGLARGSVFGVEQATDANFSLNGSNYSFSLAVPPGTGTQVTYIGTVNRFRRVNSGSGNSFVMQGRVRSFASSATNMQITNVAGDCEIEVFDSRVIASSCNTRLRDTATRFEGLHQF